MKTVEYEWRFGGGFFVLVLVLIALAADGRCNLSVHDGHVSGCEKRSP